METTVVVAAPGPEEPALEQLWPYLAGDALARGLRQAGQEVVLACCSEAPRELLQSFGVRPDRWLEAEELTLAPRPELAVWRAALTLPAWLPLDPPPLERARLARPPAGEVILVGDEAQAPALLSLLPSHCKPLPRAVVTARLPSSGLAARQARQFLASDFLRLALAAEALEPAALTQRAELGWEAWIELILHWDERVLSGDGPWSGSEQEFHSELRRLWDEAQEHRNPATFSLRRQVRIVEELALRGQRFAELHRESGSTAAQALACTSLAVFARLLEPLAPDLASRLARALGTSLNATDEVRLLAPGGRIRPLQLTLATRFQVGALQASRLLTGG